MSVLDCACTTMAMLRQFGHSSSSTPDPSRTWKSKRLKGPVSTAFAQPLFFCESNVFGACFKLFVRRGMFRCWRVLSSTMVEFRQRPYFVEYTRSHPNSEVKRRKARSVLGWGTAREALRVLLAFYVFTFQFQFAGF